MTLFGFLVYSHVVSSVCSGIIMHGYSDSSMLPFPAEPVTLCTQRTLHGLIGTVMPLSMDFHQTKT